MNSLKHLISVQTIFCELNLIWLKSDISLVPIKLHDIIMTLEFQVPAWDKSKYLAGYNL
jgi:hypothetical protein